MAGDGQGVAGHAGGRELMQKDGKGGHAETLTFVRRASCPEPARLQPSYDNASAFFVRVEGLRRSSSWRRCRRMERLSPRKPDDFARLTGSSGRNAGADNPPRAQVSGRVEPDGVDETVDQGCDATARTI